MFPEPLHLGPLTLSLYGLMAALGVLAALALFSCTAPRRGLDPAVARDFCFWVVLAGLVGARAGYVLFHWPEFSGGLGGVFAYWRGGLMFQGGVLAALLVSPLLLRRYRLGFWPAADVMAPSLALGQALGRLGCFAAGCCYGRPAGAFPFSATFPPGSPAPSGIPLVPVQLIEAAALAALTLILLWSMKGRPRRPGLTAALYLAGAGFIRLMMELFFRGDYRGDPVAFGLPPTTVAAMAASALGLLLLARRAGIIWLKPHF